MRRNTGVVLCAVTGALSIGSAAWSADHREAPLIAEDLSADIADVYTFISPTNPDNIVLAMTVNGLTVPSENVTYHFSPNVRYIFNVDSDFDAVPDRQVLIDFTDRTAGPQRYTVRVRGAEAFSITTWTGDVTQPTEEPEPNAPIIQRGNLGIKSFAGPRDDPFFFDVVGFNRFLANTGGFTGADGFAGFNVSAIVIEMPSEMLGQGSDLIQVWGSTERRQRTVRRSDDGKLEIHTGPFQQVERMGNPAINTALIPLELKDFFNIGLPENDADDFAPVIVASLMSLGTNDKNIGILASVAVPDTLKVDLTQPSEYPNGRRLDDDVIDTLFFFIFNQNKTPDGVDGNDVPFLDEFPFLAPPHQPA